MYKQLYVAYTTEGSTDKIFLGEIIERTLDAIFQQYGVDVEVMAIEWLGSAKGQVLVEKCREAHNLGAQLLIIHRDTDQHSRADTLTNHYDPYLAQLPANISAELQIVPLIIRHEQETWYFGDLELLGHLLGRRLTRGGLGLPPDIETRADTKELLSDVLLQVNEGETRGRGVTQDQLAKDYSARVDLTKLLKLESYRTFAEALETALRQLNYLPATAP